MQPVFAQWSVLGVEHTLGSYGVMLSLGLLLGALLFVGLAQRERLDVGRAVAVVGLVIGAGFVGAALTFGLVELLRTGSWPWREGRFGIVFLGGALGGACGLWAGCRIGALPTARSFDHAAWSLALGHAVGRIGCLLGGCCYGLPWNGLDGHGLLAVVYVSELAPAHDATLPRLPWPALEASAVLLLGASLWRWRKTRALRPAGRVALAYAVGYATLRLGLERFRGDTVRGLMIDGGLSTSQLLSVLVLVACVAVALRWRRRGVARLVLVLACVLTAAAHAPVKAQLAMHAAAIVSVGAGWFLLGSTDEDIEEAIALCRADAPQPEVCRAEIFEDERPQRRIFLSAYRIDRTEVSNAAYARCVAANVCAPSRVSDVDMRLSQSAQPVTGITHREAQHYCHWVGGALPTEAQWEKAARGVHGHRFAWGNLWNSRVANHGRNLGDEDPIDGYAFAAPVDAFLDARSPYGLLNVAGNAAEMVSDYYDERGYGETARTDPTGPEQGTERVVRGGSWRTPAFTLRVTHRSRIAEGDAQPDTGFRCAYAP